MAFTKIITENFQGLKGIQTFEFDNKIITLFKENGSGKTSFINALRYVLTGEEPASDAIYSGAEKMSVNIFTSDGIAFSRTKSLKDGNKCFIDKKVTTKAKFEEALSAYIPVSKAKTLLSSEFISQLSPKNLETFFLSFVKGLPKEELISYIENSANEKILAIVNAFFKNDYVTFDDINAFYKVIENKRKEFKRVLVEQNAQMNILKKKGLSQIERPIEEMQAELTKLKEKEKKAIEDKTKIKAYMAALNQKEKQETIIKQLEEELKSIPEIEISEEEPAKLIKKQGKLLKDKEDALTLVSLNSNTEKSITASLEKLNSDFCPLSDKIKCKTDKTSIKEELEEAAKSAKEAIAAAKKSLTRIEKNLTKVNDSIRELNEKKVLIQKRQGIENQLKATKSLVVELPEKPECEATDFVAEIKKIENEIKYAANYDEYLKIHAEFIKQKENWTNADAILKLFGAKGIVKQKITETFITKFENTCNKRASEFNMSFKFIPSSEGLLMVINNGKGINLSFNSLSGGEKAKVLYILMSIFSEIAGNKILLMDEISVLDTVGMQTLFEILNANSDNYEIIVVAGVNHKEAMDIFG